MDKMLASPILGAAKEIAAYASPVVSLDMNAKPDIQIQAEKAYPFIKNHNLKVKVSADPKKPYFAETYLKGDMSDPARPKEFDKDTLGVEIFRPDNFTHHDLAAEVLHNDEVANTTRQRMQKTFTPRQMSILKEQGDYNYEPDNPEITTQHRLDNATDALMRGYTVGQWPKEALDDFRFNPVQKDHMDALKNYMTTGKRQFEVAP